MRIPVRTLCVLLLAALLLCAFLASCGDVPAEESSLPPSGSESSAEPTEPSSGDAVSSPSESEGETSRTETADAYRSGPAPETKPDPNHLKGIRVLGCSFTSQQGKAAVIGTCDEGVTVKAETKYGSSEAVSYYGYFALSVDCPETNVIVTLSEWVDGEKIGKATAEDCRPVRPGSDMWGTFVGKNSQLFLEKAIPEFTGQTKLTDKALENFRKKIADRVEKAKDIGDGCELIYVIIPSAMTAYPEDVPEEYAQGEVTRYTQMMDAINAAGATAIDLRPVFRAARNDELPVYYRTDSHWAEYGAYLAYVEVFKIIAERFPAAAPRTFDEFDWTESQYQSGDMIYYLAMDCDKIREREWLRTPKFELTGGLKSFHRYSGTDSLAYGAFTSTAINGATIKTGNRDLPDVTVFRDSYSAQLMDIVAERCNVSHWPAMWSYTWNLAQLKKDEPDYVIYFVSEWNAGSLIN
ncbi:MAG: hypothetical protein ILO68_01260 [Clostridia bacterium]|nr:hypothetical protein [Clostridia bacterium]